MNNSPKTVRMLLLRHGKTNYTGTFPDLTPEGIVHVRDVAENEVLPWVQRHSISHDELGIITSPSPRAHGTAWEVAKAIGHPHRLHFADELGPMEWRDEVRALEALRPLRGRGYIQYEDEPVFLNGDIFETPGEVRARWSHFFRSFVRESMKYEQLVSFIIVSHYELLSNVVQGYFGIEPSEETALRHAEPIELLIERSKKGATIHAVFRGVTAMSCATIAF